MVVRAAGHEQPEVRGHGRVALPVLWGVVGVVGLEPAQAGGDQLGDQPVDSRDPRVREHGYAVPR